VNTNLFYYISITIFLGIYQLTSCTQRDPVERTDLQEEIRKVYDADGNLKSRFIIKDGKINGEAVTYYPSGQISTMVVYIDNKKEGIEKKYYQRGGQLYRIRPYTRGKLNGIEKRYYKTGPKKNGNYSK